MFTDNPTIPAQLEVLLDIVYTMRQHQLSTEALRQLIQPSGLPDLKPNSAQLQNHLAAADELGLVTRDEQGNVRLAYTFRGKHDARQAILLAFDRIALADARAEKWASRFYAYLIVQRDDTIRTAADAETLTHRFMSDLPSELDKSNAMNPEKYRALSRWYQYVGLGWMDPSGAFVPDPTDRIRRCLAALWDEDHQMDSDRFLTRLGSVCPELDGGAQFQEVTSGVFDPAARQCTHALAHALRCLHDERVLKLHCPADSKGWSLEKAGSSPVHGEASNRFDRVEAVRRGRA